MAKKKREVEVVEEKGPVDDPFNPQADPVNLDPEPPEEGSVQEEEKPETETPASDEAAVKEEDEPAGEPETDDPVKLRRDKEGLLATITELREKNRRLAEEAEERRTAPLPAAAPPAATDLAQARPWEGQMVEDQNTGEMRQITPEEWLEQAATRKEMAQRLLYLEECRKRDREELERNFNQRLAELSVQLTEKDVAKENKDYMEAKAKVDELIKTNKPLASYLNFLKRTNVPEYIEEVLLRGRATSKADIEKAKAEAAKEKEKEIVGKIRGGAGAPGAGAGAGGGAPDDEHSAAYYLENEDAFNRLSVDDQERVLAGLPLSPATTMRG